MIAEQLKKKPSSTFCLASGRTPKDAYAELAKLAKNKKISFSRAKFLQMDEYVGLKNKKNSLKNEIETMLLKKTNIKKQNCFFFNPEAQNLKKECFRFESLIKKKGIDFILLGIGKNCHIAFNEPNTPFNSRTHITRLSEQTRKANKALFKGEKTLVFSLTIGIKTILSAKKIVLIASGKNKICAVEKMLFGKINSRCPASSLKKHKNVLVIITKDTMPKEKNQ